MLITVGSGRTPASGTTALQRVMLELLADHTELFKQFGDNPGFKKWLSDTIFQGTYMEPPEASP
ncbi:MAG: hypothetical protein WKF75_21770 [Singulisphaera sp.]